MPEKKNIIWATGRRKTAVARVRLFPGAGTVTVNERALENYFPRDTARMKVMEPFEVTETKGTYDVLAKVHGGGSSAQSGDDGGGTNPGGSSTSGVLQGGLGLDVRVWHRFSIRGQVRDFWSGTPDLPLAATGKTRQHNFFVGGGVVWRF